MLERLGRPSCGEEGADSSLRAFDRVYSSSREPWCGRYVVEREFARSMGRERALRASQPAARVWLKKERAQDRRDGRGLEEEGAAGLGRTFEWGWLAGWLAGWLRNG